MDRKICKALILVLCFWQVSCKKDRPAPIVNKLPDAGTNVYIVGEGNYNSGTASLYAYQPLKDSVYGDLYMGANNQPLGDVLQSMQHIGDRLFLAVNNSNKIVVLGATGWKQTGSISVTLPRYILPITNTKAYVSSEYHNKIYVIDPQAQQLADSFTLPYTGTEGMCLYSNYAFICVWDTLCNKLYKVDVNTNQVVQVIALPGYAPQEVMLDKEQQLWVLSGDQTYHRPAYFTRIDPSTGDVLMAYSFPADADPVKPVFNATRDTIYFLEAYNAGLSKNGVYRMDIHAAALPTQAFIVEQPNQYLWALGLSPNDNKIYVADAKDFNQKGTVYIYLADGTQKGSFKVGPGPGHFYFDE